MNSKNRKQPFFGLLVAVILAAGPCSCASQENGSTPDRLLSFISRLSPEVTDSHVGPVSCDDRIRLSMDQAPRVLWSSRTPGAYDGVLVNVFGAESKNQANRLMYFHWNIANEVIMLLTHENIVMDSTLLVWNSAQEDVTSVFIVHSNYDPIAQVHFGAIHDRASGREVNAVIYYMSTADGLKECIVPSTVQVGGVGSCFIENSTSLESLLAEVLAGRESIKLKDYTPSDAGRNAILRRFLGLKR